MFTVSVRLIWLVLLGFGTGQSCGQVKLERLLQVLKEGTSVETIVGVIKQQKADFSLTPEIQRQLNAVTKDPRLFGAIRDNPSTRVALEQQRQQQTEEQRKVSKERAGESKSRSEAEALATAALRKQASDALQNAQQVAKRDLEDATEGLQSAAIAGNEEDLAEAIKRTVRADKELVAIVQQEEARAKTLGGDDGAAAVLAELQRMAPVAADLAQQAQGMAEAATVVLPPGEPLTQGQLVLLLQAGLHPCTLHRLMELRKVLQFPVNPESTRQLKAISKSTKTYGVLIATVLENTVETRANLVEKPMTQLPPVTEASKEVVSRVTASKPVVSPKSTIVEMTEPVRVERLNPTKKTPIQLPQATLDLAKTSGVPVLEIFTARDGSVKSFRIKSGHPTLGKGLGDIVKYWQFEPYRINGKALEAVFELRFDLKATK